MIRLSLDELRRIANDDVRLAQQLREMHLSTWADTLERQTRIVTGD